MLAIVAKMLSYAFTSLIGACLTSVAYGQVTISKTPQQVMNGIGASGAWWPMDLYMYPEQVREEVASLLFSSSGMGLTSYRYNVGGGGVFVGTWDRAPETFYVSPGVYNWSADPQGVYFLKKAAEYKVPLITAFVNSAPASFTDVNQNCGGTLLDSKIPEYAQYLADVIGHWRDEGILINYVSPMNEPDNSFGDTTTPCGQEGMIVTPEQRAPVVNALRAALDAAGLQAVGIMADESSSTGTFIPEAPVWIPEAKNSLAAVCHHQYAFANDSRVAQMGQVARNESGGKPTWWSEICCFAAADTTQASDPNAVVTWSQGYDPTMVGGLQLAKLVYQSFTQTLDVHFDWWTALSNGLGCTPSGNSTCPTTVNWEGWNDGLIYFDSSATTNGNYGLYLTKRFYIMKHFAQFIPIGSVRFEVDGLPDKVLSLAFKTTSSVSLIVMNLNTTPVKIDLHNVGLGAMTAAFQTTDAKGWEKINRKSKVTLPGASMTTFVF